ncbi:MAG: PIN domain-containing protein, partial [Sideroxydans sp.]|nr:PIN domain-containing protein [Sideroxydans sp.]
LFVSHIVWQELRTQFLQSALSDVMKLRQQFNDVRRRHPSDMILQGLRPPVIDLWDESEIRARSHVAMDEYARDNRINIVPISDDHANRAWDRYFEVNPPFNPEVTDREKRRKDIPDSWILEAAIDVQRNHSGLLAVCKDGNLAGALEKVLAIRVFRTVAEAIEHLDSAMQSVRAVQSAKTRDAVYVQPTEAVVRGNDELAAVFAEAEVQFRNVATKVIGLVSYLGSPTKDQLYTLLERADIPLAIGKNVAERLALSETIQDTGHHYIPGDKQAGAQAIAAVEPEIIRLVMGED